MATNDQLAKRFTELTIKDFKTFAECGAPLRPLNVLIGPNGSGKTSFMDVFRLLAEGTQGRFAAGISQRGGMGSLLRYARQGEDEPASWSFHLATEVAGNDQPLTYHLEVRRRGAGYEIASEVLSPYHAQGYRDPFKWIDNRPGHPRYFDDTSKHLVAPTWEYNEAELALAQVPKLYPVAEGFRNRLAKTEFLSFLDVSQNAPVRNPQDLDPLPRMPGPNGANLVSALYNIRSTDEDTYQRIVEALHAAFREFRGIDFPLVAAGKAALTWKEEPFTKALYANQVSEGTLRFLWLTAVLLSPQLPPVLLVDEPEVSLHPEMLKVLAGLLREAAAKSQVFVATHSDRLIRWLEPGDLLILDKEEGVTRVRRGDDPELNLAEWLNDYTLDQLWLMGQAGGRP
jgi:predicted ATPase